MCVVMLYPGEVIALLFQTYAMLCGKILRMHITHIMLSSVIVEFAIELQGVQVFIKGTGIVQIAKVLGNYRPTLLNQTQGIF